jgi:hypothetical protein
MWRALKNLNLICTSFSTRDRPIRENGSVVLISIFASRHHLSDAAVKDLLKLISLHCPCPDNCTKSEFRYKRIRRKLLCVKWLKQRQLSVGHVDKKLWTQTCA